MGVPPRSIFRPIAAATVAAALLFQQPASVLAQEQPAATANATEPVVVVTLGSINKLMEDVNYMSATFGQAQLGGMFAMLAGTFTQGIDPTQPIGVLLPLVDGVPQPVAMIPTGDVKSVLRRLEAQTGPADELDDGTLVIAVGANTIYIKQQGGWAVVAANRESLALAPADPGTMLQEMGANYDLAFRVHPQKVPAEMRDMLVSQIRQGFEQAMASQAGGDADTARDLAENSIASLEQVITDTEMLSFGINIDTAGKQLVIDGAFTAVPGSSMAAMYAGQQPIPSRFASVIRDDAAAYYHSASSISPEAIEQTRASLASTISVVEGALGQEGNLSATQRAEITELIERVVEIAGNTVAEGRLDMGVLLMADEDKFQLVLGAFVADGNEVAQLVKDLAAAIENEPGSPEFQFDLSTYNGITMHAIEAEVPADEEEVRQVFGEKLRVHLGTGENAVYAAVGRDSETLLKQFIDSGANDTGAADRPIGQLKVKARPILEFVQSIQANDIVASMIETLSRSTDQGEVNFISDKIANGQDFRLTISEALLQAIGAAVQQTQAAQMQAQF